MGYYIRELKNKTQAPKWKVQFITQKKEFAKDSASKNPRRDLGAKAKQPRQVDENVNEHSQLFQVSREVYVPVSNRRYNFLQYVIEAEHVIPAFVIGLGAVFLLAREAYNGLLQTIYGSANVTSIVPGIALTLAIALPATLFSYGLLDRQIRKFNRKESYSENRFRAS